MEAVFYTLQDFFSFAKGTTYILMGCVLVIMVPMWNFIVSRDENEWPEAE